MEFQKYVQEAQLFDDKAVTSICEFWTLLLQPTILISDFNTASKNIRSHTESALMSYRTLLRMYPKAHRILFNYAKFANLVLNDNVESGRYFRLAEELKSIEDENTFNIDENVRGKAEDQCVVNMNESGIIEEVNKPFLKMFGWRKADIVGRDIKAIIPHPWKDIIDKSTGITTIVGQSKNLFALHKDGHSFPMRLDVRESRNESGKKSLIGVISFEDVDEELNTSAVVLSDETGLIKMVTLKTIDLFGYKAREMVGKVYQ